MSEKFDWWDAPKKTPKPRISGIDFQRERMTKRGYIDCKTLEYMRMGHINNIYFQLHPFGINDIEIYIEGVGFKALTNGGYTVDTVIDWRL